MKAPLVAISLLLLCFLTYAQELKVDEFIALGKKNKADINKALIAKGFVKQYYVITAGDSLFTYLYKATNGSSLILRMIQLTADPNLHFMHLDYGVQQKGEAAMFADELEREGFFRTVKGESAPGGAGKAETALFKRNYENISYLEVPAGLSRLYIFGIENDHYNP